MRFDDMLATVLARPADRPAARIAQWRQLIDLLAQRRAGGDPAAAREALARIAALRADVPVSLRRESARAIAGRPVPAGLIAVLAADVPAVAGMVLGQARLSDAEWLAILPRLSPTGRGFLRHRRDLSSAVVSALAGFGASDLALHADPNAARAEEESETAGDMAEESLVLVEAPAAASPAPPRDEPFQPELGEGQIRAIISRIARYRETRAEPLAAAARAGEAPRVTRFRFETGPEGTIRRVEDAPRGVLIGETIAFVAGGSFGVDGQAPGAFRRRSSFRDARLRLPGSGPAAGEWRIAGVPVFGAQDGRFLGYRCTARRPRPDESAEPADAGESGLYGGGMQPDSLRQLVHELRTPLNAIGGFAEMIRRQMRGPAAAPYRERAERIAHEAARLLAAVDDLDIAARLDTQRLDLRQTVIDLPALIESVRADHVAAARRLGATLETDAPPGLPQALGDPAAVRRLIARLVASAVALAGAGETIRVAVRADGEGAPFRVEISRPARLAGAAEAELTDPGYGPDGEWPDAPLLGLGFSLRLVRHLAAAGGGGFVIDPDRFVLRLRPADDARHAGAGG